MKKYHPMFFPALYFFLGAIAMLLFVRAHSPSFKILDTPLREGRIAFTNPLLLCSVTDIIQSDIYKPLGEKVGDIIDKNIDDGNVTHASFYFKDLDTGYGSYLNEKEKYAPASLLKIALMIAYFKNAETEPSILSREVVFRGSLNPALSNEDKDKRLKLGATYTIKDLIFRMIAYSDNDAKDLLHNNINQKWEEDVFSDLGLGRPGINSSGDIMTVKDLSRFFRILYNATYLNKKFSEMAISILSQTTYDQGIVRGVPTNIIVAHKFGYRVFSEPEEKGLEELHDCGIVYGKKMTYFVCVMTKGHDKNKLTSIIQEISQVVYKQVNE